MDLRDVVRRMRSSLWIRIVLFVLVCSALFIIRENVDISLNTSSYINLMLISLFFLTVYLSIKRKKIQKVKLFLVISVAFIFNKLYDKIIFYSIFRIELEKVFFFAGVAILMYILLPYVWKIVVKVFIACKNFILAWISVKDEEEQKDKALEILHSEDPIEKTIIVKERREKIRRTPRERKKNQSDRDENKTTLVEKIAYVIIAILITGVPGLFLVYISSDNLRNIGENITTATLIDTIISMIGFIFLLIVVFAVAIGIVIKLAQSIWSLFSNKKKEENYFLYAGGFLFIVIFLSKNRPISVDEVIDLAVNGEFFSYPLILVILLPVLFIFLESLGKYIKNNTDVVEKIVKLIEKIAVDSVVSLLNFIKFVTADFLTSIKELVQEDLEDDE